MPGNHIPTLGFRWPETATTDDKLAAVLGELQRAERDRDELLAALKAVRSEYRARGYCEAETLMNADDLIARIEAGK